MMSELKQRKLRNCNILPTTTIKIHMEGVSSKISYQSDFIRIGSIKKPFQVQ